MTARARAIGCVVLAGIAASCAPPPPFEQDLAQGRWSAAATAFDADTTLLMNERALFDAAMLFSSPVREAYDPAKGRALLERLLARFPNGPHRVAAQDRLALLDAIDTLEARGRQSSARARDASARIALLVADTLHLRAQVDSLAAAKGGADRNAARLEEQLRELRSELERLKEIDLKRKPPLDR